ncbi:hypothetical protein B0T22DRAFT_514670 [Podospora appendiculata]|uniref:Rhodopsin domain-containing protein n=1 Tax=Podospora appendiculata TaxID=314037 RepID=A0AAE0XCN9_9PEZI|nr:hypothetical protein B0T22DRAFT_514670 [Podospora appendiculata]
MALSQATNIVILMIVFSVLPIIAVVLRFYARRLQPTKLAWDDWLIIPGLMFTVGLNVTVIIGVFIANLGGHKTAATTRETIIASNQISWAIELLNVPAIILVKSSIVMFYYRIFHAQGRVFLVIVWVLLGLIALRISFFFAGIFKCVPIQNIWLVNTPGHNGCNEYILDYQVSAISNAVTDFLILIVPIPFVWQMRLPLRKRIGVIGIFLLGGFTLVAAILRVYFFQSVGNKINQGLTDTTYYQAPVFYWTAIENSIAVICACLPLMRTIVVHSSVERAVRRSWDSLRSRRGKSGRGTGSAGDSTPPSLEVQHEHEPHKVEASEASP